MVKPSDGNWESGIIANSQVGYFNSKGGVFYATTSGYSQCVPYGGNNTYSSILQLDLSRSSSIYGKSSTVTPLSRKTTFIIKY